MMKNFIFDGSRDDQANMSNASWNAFSGEKVRSPSGSPSRSTASPQLRPAATISPPLPSGKPLLVPLERTNSSITNASSGSRDTPSRKKAKDKIALSARGSKSCDTIQLPDKESSSHSSSRRSLLYQKSHSRDIDQKDTLSPKAVPLPEVEETIQK